VQPSAGAMSVRAGGGPAAATAFSGAAVRPLGRVLRGYTAPSFTTASGELPLSIVDAGETGRAVPDRANVTAHSVSEPCSPLPPHVTDVACSKQAG
jgi:hypothetical protein